MKTKISVKIPEKKAEEYQVVIGNGVSRDLAEYINFSNYSKCAILTDSTLETMHYDTLRKSLPLDPCKIIIPAGEPAKNIHSLESVWQQMLDHRLDRKSLVLNLGGGVIGDLGGFAAATFMRGIDFIQIPTTLLSQVDASVGGKLAINLGNVKNLCGSFAQPKLVVCDVDYLGTLSPREIRSGYAEVIKHGLIRSKKYLDFVAERKLEHLGQDEWALIVKGSVEIKSDVVSKDETEGGYRKILNFGHTIGHAIEALSHEHAKECEAKGKEYKPYLHGEAIALGMLAEARLSKAAGLLDSTSLDYVLNLIIATGFSAKLDRDINAAGIYDKLLTDKKNIAGSVKWTLLKGLGEAVFDQEVSKLSIVEAVESII